MIAFSRRFRVWLAAILLAVATGTGAIVAATCAAVYSAGDAAAPPASEPAAAAAFRNVAGLSFPSLMKAGLPPPDTQPSPLSALSSLPFVWPADGYVSQAMSPRHPSGIDIAVGEGSDIYAARDGVVFFAGGDPCCSYGRYIVIAHDEGWITLYGHLSELKVKAGDEVKKGQVIALSGATGHAIGAHLHFELRSASGIADPLDHLWPPRYIAPDDATPTPTAVATPPALVGLPQPPAAQPAGEDPDLGAQEAIVLALGWMGQNAEFAYEIDTSTCVAMQDEVNWLVTCKATLRGCTGLPCEQYLSACVLDQPRLIARFCP